MATTRTRRKPRSAAQKAATKKMIAAAKRARGPKKAAKKSAKRTTKKAAKNPYAKKGSTSLLAKRYGAVKTLVLTAEQARVLGKLMRSHDCHKEKGLTVCKTRTGHVKAVLHHA